jgi:hypothetical protein
VESRHKDSLTKKKFKTRPSTGKSSVLPFGKIGSYILVDILEQDNSAHYVETMKKQKISTAGMGQRREENILIACFIRHNTTTFKIPFTSTVYNEFIDFNGVLLHVSAYEKPSSGRYTLTTYS